MSAILANTNITLDNTSAITIPGTPSTGQTVIYPKADKLLYYKNDAGQELPPGKVVQVVNFQTGAVATGTTTIPTDDTIPQITEGNEYMTLAITPTNASNILMIQVVGYVYSTVNSEITHALFVGNTANALAAVSSYALAGITRTLGLTHSVVAGTTSALTFRVRLGADAAGTTTFNGYNGTRRFGGVASSSITITEYTA
jgi:hypothetical protein